jgi:hypothetical protein
MYVAELRRLNGVPNRVLKVGITNAKDPMYRLMYKQPDEQYPISKYFPDIRVVKVREFRTKEEAERNERRVMGMVKKRFNSERFHDWRENDKISGITEMRIWRLDEAKYVEEIL